MSSRRPRRQASRRAQESFQSEQPASNSIAGIEQYYVGYAMDEETPEMIEKKFENMERVRAEASSLASALGAAKVKTDETERTDNGEQGAGAAAAASAAVRNGSDCENGSAVGETDAGGEPSPAVGGDDDANVELLKRIFRATSNFSDHTMALDRMGAVVENTAGELDMERFEEAGGELMFDPDEMVYEDLDDDQAEEEEAGDAPGSRKRRSSQSAKASRSGGAKRKRKAAAVAAAAASDKGAGNSSAQAQAAVGVATKKKAKVRDPRVPLQVQMPKLPMKRPFAVLIKNRSMLEKERKVRESRLASDPAKFLAVDDMLKVDFARLHDDLGPFRGILISPPWDAEAELAGYPGRSVTAVDLERSFKWQPLMGTFDEAGVEAGRVPISGYGMAFVWTAKQHMAEVIRWMERNGLLYVENFAWVSTTPFNGLACRMSPYFRQAKQTMLMFRQRVATKNEPLELKHQRVPDTHLEMMPPHHSAPYLPEHWKDNHFIKTDEIYRLIETLLPRPPADPAAAAAAGPGANLPRARVFVELWAPPHANRPGWVHIHEKLSQQSKS